MTFFSPVLVLFLFAVGTLCSEPGFIGKLPERTRSQTSLGVFGGNKAPISKYPYLVSLKQNGTLAGSAVIIENNWLLTTGWNVNGATTRSLTLRAGSSFYRKGGQVVKAKKIIVHPKYSPTGWDYDIAVIKLETPLKFGKNINAIKLGTKKLKGGVKVWVAGWGEYDATGNPSEHLLETQVTTYDWDKCQKVFGTYLTKNLMCTMDTNSGPCNADFSDPLVHENHLYGAFAGGFGCQPGRDPVIYTDVCELHGWIKNAIKSDTDDEV